MKTRQFSKTQIMIILVTTAVNNSNNKRCHLHSCCSVLSIVLDFHA